MKLNHIQEKAVNLIDENITLIAGAGTGKTRVLTSRFINIVKHNTLPRNILAITFTNKAAEEMKSRISKEMVEEEISFDESELNIMTIHAFCLEMIKDYSLVIGINPNFDVCDEAMSTTLIKESVKKVLYTYKGGDYESYLKDFRTTPFEELDEFINLYNDFRNNNYDFDEILHKSLIFEDSSGDFNNLLILLEDYSKVLKPTSKFNKLYLTEEFEEIRNSSEYNGEILDKILNNLGSSKPNQDKIHEITEYIVELKKNLESKNKDYYIFIIDILKEIDKEYSTRKNFLNLLDYDDIIIYTSEIIENEYLKKEIQERYKYILIDEYQDTNKIQNKIVRNFRDSNLFIVGDPKQSIYAFRGSDLDSYYNFSDYVKSMGKSLLMNINYRSDKNIIDFINNVFNEILDPYEELISDQSFDGGVYLYNTDKKSEIVNLVKDLQKNFDVKDIAILARSNNQIQELSEVFYANDIAFNKGKKNIKEIEVLKLANNILSTIYSPDDFIKTLSLFNSPILNFKFEDLLNVLNSNAKSFEDLLNIEKKGDKLEKFINFLVELQEKSKTLYLDEVAKEVIKYFYSLKNLTSNEMKYLFQFQDIITEFVEKFSSDYRLFEEYIELKEFDDLEDGINLLTIHRSKGLEFKALIISNMDSKRSKNVTNKIVVSENGLGIKSKYSNYKFKNIVNFNKDMDSEEEKRILYVAMTRAMEKLILFGNFDKPQSDSYFKMMENCDLNLLDYEFTSEERKAIEVKTYENLGSFENNESRIREYYTVTDFINFKRNREDFYKKYFLGIDEYTMGSGKEQVMDPMLLGTIVHFFAENYSKKDIKIDDIKIYIERIFNFYEEELTEEKYKLVSKLCKNYLEMEEDDIIYKELLYYYSLNGYLVKGFIDQVVIIDGEYYIIDLKTSSLPIGEIYETYKDQLILYSKFFEDLYKITVKGAYIFDLRGRNKIYVETNVGSERDIIKEFEKFIKFLRCHNSYKDYI
ncbi:UvrD-helicase domain-containing protein [Peptoniphilus sp. MSJ-1]|uniref:DNA 3'-5' helicase n=1 Tax=Peptoniphilus ovalis TaxID=2841503 RepID=A0ABS6FGU2_9FIRM|nr:UvrD-helicase domain-containing protein [Peptoniphilus ovalis]MBU5669398.1 UvrD-helicase domain-containing protein [Peptoniphilus ovalis]